MKKIILILLFIVGNITAQKINISGFVTDKNTGEKIINANVFVKNSTIGTVTNEYGYYSLYIPKNQEITIKIGFVGYKNLEKKLRAEKSLKINFELVPDNQLETVELHFSTKSAQNIQAKEISTVQIPIQQIKQLPAIGGEPDLMKAYQLLPGISSGKEGSSDLFVRGGSPDQNLMLIDGVPLYYVNHLGGFVSVFNIDAINSVKLIKGGFPARYGNRLSSVVDIRMKDGNRNKRSGSFTIGLLNAKLMLEGPLGKKASYMVSARRMLYDLIMFPVSYIGTDKMSSFGYHFYDFNGKINYQINLKNHLYFSVYGGDDIFAIRNYKDTETSGSNQGDFESKYQKKWGNKLSSLRWYYDINNKLELITRLSYSKYRFYIGKKVSSDEKKFQYESNYISDIQDARINSLLNINISNNYKITTGSGFSYHWFNPSVLGVHISQNNEPQDYIKSSYKQSSIAYYFFIENHINFHNKLFLNLGIRNSDLVINKHQFVSFEPRLMFRYQFNKSFAVKGAYSKMQQNLHLLSTTGLGMPVDLWLPATNDAPPEQSELYVFGISKSIGKPYQLSIETFYKTINNLITYKPGATFKKVSYHWEDKIYNNGLGKSYGVEFLLQKKTGKHTGWLSYTWSKTTRQFNEINNNFPYPFNYDRRNDISIVYNYNFNKHIQFSATWNYGTGYPFSMEINKFYTLTNLSFSGENYNLNNLYEYTTAYEYSKPNSLKMRDFHRLDIGVNFIKQKKYGIRTWNFSIINVYNRKNPYFYYLSSEETSEGHYKTIVKQYTLFPFLPSFSYSYKF